MKTEVSSSFIDELLAEAENAEVAQQESYYDLVLGEVARLKIRIREIFDQADAERAIVEQFALRQSTKVQDRISFLEKQLACYLTSRNLKTLELPRGTLRYRKAADRVEVSDVAAFLERATSDMLTIVPESVKPRLSGIKKSIKRSGGKIPPGVRIVEGKPQFSYQLREDTDGAAEKTSATAQHGEDADVDV